MPCPSPASRATATCPSTIIIYYLVRGFAVVEASGIGTYGSEGFELCGTHLERDSHVAVVEWLTGSEGPLWTGPAASRSRRTGPTAWWP